MDAPDPEGLSGPDEPTKPGFSLSATEAALSFSPAGPGTPSVISQELRAAIERADMICGVALDQPSHVESRQRLLLELDGLGGLLQSESVPMSDGIDTAFHLVRIQAEIVRLRIDLARHKPPDDTNAASSIHHAMSELLHGFDRLRQAMILAAS
jgi:hypothetical protein